MNRKLTKIEKELMRSIPLFDEKYRKKIEDSIDDFLVYEMDDGGMGSLHFVYKNDFPDRVYKKCISQVETKDSDGIPVLISLDIDNFDRIHELDIWKCDFNRLISLNDCLKNYLAYNND